MTLEITPTTSPEIQSRTSDTTDATLTYASRAYVTGEVVIVEVIANWGSQIPTAASMQAPTGGSGVTWTLVVSSFLDGAGGGGTGTRAWVGVVPSDQSFAITQTTTTQGLSNLSVRGIHRRWSGADTTTPIGNTDIYESSTTDPLTSAANLDIAVLAGSQICAAGGDWNASTTITCTFDSSVADTEDLNSNESGQMHYVSIRSTNAVGADDASVRAGFDVSGGNGFWSSIIYEIRAASHVAISIVQAAGDGTAGGTSVAVALPGNVTAGNHIIVATHTKGDPLIGVPADTQGRTYVLVATQPSTDGDLYVHAAPVGAGGNTPTVTSTYTSGEFASIVVVEIFGLLDGTADVTPVGALGTSTSAAAGPTAGASSNGSLGLSVCSVDGGEDYSTAGGFTTVFDLDANPGSVLAMNLSSKTVAAAATFSAAATLGSSGQWAALAIIFEAATEAAPSAPTALTGQSGKPGFVPLTWTVTPSDPALTDHDVDFALASAPTSWLGEVSTGSTSGAFTKTGLTNGVAYVFRVRGVNSVGDGAWSSTSAEFTPDGSEIKLWNTGRRRI